MIRNISSLQKTGCFKVCVYKGTYKSPLLLETNLKLHDIQIEGRLIGHVVHVAEISMIEAGIDGLYRGKVLGGFIRDIEPLKFIY